jgi:hypothetical protein
MRKDKNGWIKIESVDDLPGGYSRRFWIANKNGVFDFFADIIMIRKKFENGTVTHYQELIEISPPEEYKKGLKKG